MRIGFVHILLLLSLVACQNNEPQQTAPTKEVSLISILSSAETGISFSNDIKESPQINRLTYEYLYNGGGVAAGDINNDGMPDLYFTGNMVPDRLYLNKGNMQFEDITERSGIPFEQDWHTGVCMVDINADGWLDIYVVRSGWYQDKEKMRNRLYLNNGDETFTESAAAFGLDDPGKGVQAAFFDADRDGDLDAYILNNPESIPEGSSLAIYKAKIETGEFTTDRFLLNEGGKFVDYTTQGGFVNFGYRHGVAVEDFNNDGFPDLYISSDFHDPDYLYINQGNGTFKDEILNYTNHISMFSMGNDAADVNNDGWMDLIVVDMTPADHERSKQNMASMNPQRFFTLVEQGFHHQYMANALHLNNGNGSFSDIANMAGVAYTDWSWASLFLDLDLDGWQDLFVTNGVRRDVLNNDVRLQSRKLVAQQGQVQPLDVINLMPENKLNNCFFRNTGKLYFEDMTEQWLQNQPSYSNGAAYADLDQDGDWELVVNNIDEVATIYKNQTRERTNAAYLKIKLKEDSKNPYAIGARVTVHGNNKTSYTQTLMPIRGFNSSVEPCLLFGLGAAGNTTKLDVHVEWPDGEHAVYDATPNQTLIIQKGEGKTKNPDRPNRLFSEIDLLDYVHKEGDYNDFGLEILLPHKRSTEGPCLAWGDINGDDRHDVFIGGAANQSGAFFLQQENGSFKELKSMALKQDAGAEDQAAVFFDADNDGDLDLYVGSGSNEFSANHPLLRDRLYLNDGKGQFLAASNFPSAQNNTSCAAVGDIDSDGDLDLFVGSGNKPRAYPEADPHLLYLNNGGLFQRTELQALQQVGMLSDAEFGDLDRDGDPDLVVAGEWTAIEIFRNDKGDFTQGSGEAIPEKLEGWWQSLFLTDMDDDGDIDILAGNIGLNNKFHPSSSKPFKLYAKDFDNNGSQDIVLSKQYKGRYVPVRGKECSSEQMPFIAEKFPTYKGFAEASLDEIIGEDQLEGAIQKTAYEFASGWLEQEEGGFVFHAFPPEAQLSPTMDFALLEGSSESLGDAGKSLILVGNRFGAEVETVRYDAGIGTVLTFNGQHGFKAIHPTRHGLRANANAKSCFYVPENNVLIVANNNAPVQTFKLRTSSKKVIQ